MCDWQGSWRPNSRHTYITALIQRDAMCARGRIRALEASGRDNGLAVWRSSRENLAGLIQRGAEGLRHLWLLCD